jgi:hypothetical protein
MHAEFESSPGVSPPEDDGPEASQSPGGAEGGDESPAAERLPAEPASDDTALGDTDQHSDA